MPRPEGLFIQHLPASVFSEAEPFGLASQWVSDALLASLEVVRAELNQPQRVPHVFFTGALRPHVARGLAGALRRARFRRHHHAPYPLDVAPAELPQPPELASFVRWLGSPLGCAFHSALAGWQGPPLQPAQVQVSRMLKDQSFPPHFDTSDEGLAAVYYPCPGWKEGAGGQLEFPRDDGSVELRVPPLENSLFLFAPRGAVHAVTPISSPRWRRYAVVAFYLAPGGAS